MREISRSETEEILSGDREIKTLKIKSFKDLLKVNEIFKQHEYDEFA